MDRDGHLGLALLLYFSILYLFKQYSTDLLIIGLLTALFSSLPDIDIRLRMKHRGVTHSIFTGIIIGVAVGYLFHYVGFGFYMGFLSVILGYIFHILGDLFTYQPFKPFYPFSNVEISFRLFRSDNIFVNKLFLISGVSILVLYLFDKIGLDIF